ncbi:hypothetical protein B0T16DRAFT_454333 [Cercophora newfieldiana]|uniref:PH domain-containing protein n=1 Tax=Cercophora newfieldiana TaxID=92897 RepID=A0AA39YG46_9PEZI|nr:hypothetical protein B0T16DRAFT_454333 [Cercophora newfieldiana]
MNFIEAGGRGHTDAPRGASNGGERRVAVRCRGAALDLLVGAETTAYDILVASSKQTIQTFNVKTSTLTECYAELGLERRIRRYERIRDILNSWDQDTQHSLVVSPDLLMPSNDLDLASVPHTDKPPSGFILSLYHLQKPRKWSKRYITLLEGGQLVLSKKLEPGPSDRDCVNLCHLSDFDIYVPIEAQKRKQLKPPKKHCYAVKSQQKAAVFQRHENYVHYFCTDDPDVGQEFFDGVHAWRSWYIANRVLELFTEKKKVTPENPPQILPDKPSSPKKSVGHVKVNGHRVKVSVDESPYAIGRFEPLINLQRFEKPLEEFGNDWVPDPRRSVPPQSAPSTGNSEANGDARKDLSVNMPERGQGAFEEGGLLGAAYDKRKQAQRDGNRRSQMSDKASPVPFTEGRSLLNDRRSSSATASTTTNTRPPVSPSSTEKSADSKRSSDKAESSGWFPSAIEHSAKTRPVAHRPNIPSSPGSHNERDQYGRHYYQNPQLHANRRPPQPLVDLTPSFIEPPQWSRQGAGRGYRVPEGKPLVDFATGPPVSSSRGYEPPPRALVRRGDAGSIHSNSSAGTASQRQGSSGGLGRRQTVRSDRPPVSSSGRLMGQYDQNRGPLLSFPNGENRGRSFTSSSGPPLGMGGGQMRSSPASSVVASEREVRRTGRERSGTLA